jgi:type IV pilus assembly protein PilE
MNHMGKGNAGYSLVELMIVVAIIGVIAAIAIPSYSKFQVNNYRARAGTSMVEVRSALVSYQAMRVDGTLTGVTSNSRYLAKVQYMNDSNILDRYAFGLQVLADGRFYLTMAPKANSGQENDGVLVASVSGDVCRFKSTDNPASLTDEQKQNCLGGERM